MRRLIVTFGMVSVLILGSYLLPAQDVGFGNVDDISNIASKREESKVMDEILAWRLEHMLPDMMRKRIRCPKVNTRSIIIQRMLLNWKPSPAFRSGTARTWRSPWKSRASSQRTGSTFLMVGKRRFS